MKRLLIVSIAAAAVFTSRTVALAELKAGVAKVDITDRTGPVNDPLFAKALVLEDGDAKAVLITIDAVAIGAIGRIGNGVLPMVRAQLEAEFGIPPAGVLINASHCHGVVRNDVGQLVVQAVREAHQRRIPVRAGTGTAHEDRISENRRIRMKDGSEADMRRAYSLPRHEDIASVGPIDPQVGILRLDRMDGTPLAVVYNFACHPIMNPPGKGNSADFPGFASELIEEALGEGALALFVQGCGGDINPRRYKDVTHPPDAEPLGHRLGLTVLQAVRKISTGAAGPLKILHETVALPRAADFQRRIEAIEAEQAALVKALKPTNINFRIFVPLLIQQRLWPEFPSQHAQSYLHDQMLEREDLTRLDAENRASVEAYLNNIEAMERLTRLNVNRALLQKHLAETQAAGATALEAEMSAIRVGDFRLITFPSELTVEIGLNLKRAAPAPHTFVAGYTNGYLFYTPTAAQRSNSGYAQEDCDTLVAPEWQQIFESRALKLLEKL